MIRDARVLRAGFVPREVEHRDAEVNHLSSVLEPITNDEPADTAIVTGPSGTGKTCISKLVTERLREEVLDVEAIYVNCWRNYTRFRTLYKILDDPGTTIDIHRQSTPHDELVDRLVSNLRSDEYVRIDNFEKANATTSSRYAVSNLNNIQPTSH
jgi:Cdc6-like AAA superfamily ATPase